MNIIVRPMKNGNHILTNFFEIEVQAPCCQTMEHLLERRRHDDVLRSLRYNPMRGYRCPHCNREINIQRHNDYAAR